MISLIYSRVPRITLMKINCHKIPQGFIPATDREADQIKKIPNGAIIELEYKTKRNYEFHKKVFAFFNFCFDFWVNENEFLDEYTSFDMFRKNLLVVAGYKQVYYKIDGSLRVEAKSLAYDKMNQEEFEQCYHALIQAAMNTLFTGHDEYYDRLVSFF